MVKLCSTEMPVTRCQRDCSCFTVVYIFTVNLLCFSDAMAQIQSPFCFCDQEVSSLKLKQPLTVDTCVNPQLIWITLSFLKNVLFGCCVALKVMISHLCRLPIRQHDGENRENWKSATTGHCADHSVAKCCHWIVHIKLNNFLSFQVRWWRSRWAPLNVGFMKHLGGKSSLAPLHQIIPFCQNCNDEFTFRRLPIRPKWAAETVTNWIEMYRREKPCPLPKESDCKY